jgi:transposase
MIDEALARRLVTAARKGREWQRRRDELVVEALKSGASQREVAKLVGLTQPAIHVIYRKYRESA